MKTRVYVDGHAKRHDRSVELVSGSDRKSPWLARGDRAAGRRAEAVNREESCDTLTG